MLRFVLVVFLMVFVVTAPRFCSRCKRPDGSFDVRATNSWGRDKSTMGSPQKALIPIGGLAVGALVFDRADNETAGVAIFAGTWIWSIFDGPMSADKINPEKSVWASVRV